MVSYQYLGHTKLESIRCTYQGSSMTALSCEVEHHKLGELMTLLILRACHTNQVISLIFCLNTLPDLPITSGSFNQRTAHQLNCAGIFSKYSCVIPPEDSFPLVYHVSRMQNYLTMSRRRNYYNIDSRV
jgi:hypothetical protein